jgi:hypothetical protein
MTYKAGLLIVNEFGQVLARGQGTQLTLPEVDVEQGRVGISLSSAVREQLHPEVFCLVLPEAAITDLHVLRLQPSRKVLAPGLVWVRPGQLPNAGELETILQHVSATAENFGGYAWYGCVALWLQQQLRTLGFTIRELEQWNGRIGGVLLRVATNGPDFWFKAVSDFNLREMAIAQLLASRHPAHFPRILATEHGWNAFLLEHVEGTELYDCDDLETWKRTARLLAEIQMDWTGNSDPLLKAGAADLRAATMVAKIPGFLDHVDDAMARQPKTPPVRLTRVDLDELGNALYALCADVATLRFSDGLANADFSPHNTLITSRGPVFIDWAEACASLPLIAGEYMWNRMVVESSDRVQWRSALRTAYLRRWAEGYGAAAMEEAAKLLPAFSIFAVAMFYHERESHGPSPYDSYLRSLARKLDNALKRGEADATEINRLQATTR